MRHLYDIAENEHIAVEYKKLRAPLRGFYYTAPDCSPIIGLDHSLHSNYRLHRCVMAEELGHHFTSSGVRIAKRHCSTQDRLTIDKIEYKALRWAANFLVPENDLLDAIASGLIEVWELAEDFDVTDEMMRFRMRLFGERQKTIRIR